MPLNDTSNYTGLIQDCETLTNLGVAGISGDTALLKQFTAGMNNAFDEVLPVLFSTDAKWQYDDPNHTDQPIATTDLVSGQSTYNIVSDEDGNSVLTIQAVYIKDPDSQWQKLDGVDSPSDVSDILAQDSTDTGTPTRYDKNGVSLILDPIPDYASTGGLRVILSRTPSYFLYTDTTKKAGIPRPYQRLLSLIQSRDWVAVHKTDNPSLLKVILGLIESRKRDLGLHMSKRSRDERTVMRVRQESSR